MAEKTLLELFMWIEDNLFMNLSVQISTDMLVAIPTSTNSSLASAWPDRTSIIGRTDQIDEPSSLPIHELADCAEREMRRYLQTSDADTKYGYELFRRALDLRDEAAWYALSECYYGLLKSWVTKNPKFVTSGEDADYFVNRAFERLWRNVALRPDQFERFEDLASLLKYTKLCVHSSVIDDAPAISATVETNSNCFIEERFDEIEYSEFWQRVEKFLNDDAEWILMSGFFIEGLKNRELLELYPDHFEDAKQISNKRTSILRRLSRNIEFKEVLQEFFHDDRDRSGALIC